MEFESFYEKIQDALHQVPDNIRILEKQIDIELQTEYFRQSREMKEGLDAAEVLGQAENLFNDTIPLDQKQKLLVQLASLERIEALRLIERFKEENKSDLTDWTEMAFQESRIRLESSLLGERPLFISSGLGGRGHKFRYFGALFALEDEPFTDWQKDLLEKEILFALERYDSELESIEFHEGFVALTAMIPIREPLRNIFRDIILECNQIGGFLRTDMLITNVKQFNADELRDILVNKILKEENNNEQAD
ncbi:hypothetical protein PbJCM13498_05820 [Prolixibacter bellariivorans]|uniref:Uncharacterized protein n=1 Tax=Prolixibacter bellariivorans TaxID=314319 RepID=A0A5M4AUU4_9BACT|nr:hypothetical protein [Prolixibacter bellariivorans]GET31719.1 hypothetical protein PbJCM13498_05820 [Prolixibacter bellariivorans]